MSEADLTTQPMLPDDALIVWQGADYLRPMLRDINTLVPAAGNPRKGDVEALKQSLQRWGQVRPVLTHHDGEHLVAGHHVTLAAKALGWTHVAVGDHTFETPGEARAYLLADNELAALGGYDEQAQLDLAEEVSGNLFGTGVTHDKIEDWRARQGQIPEMPATGLERPWSEDEKLSAERAAILAAHRQMKEVVMLVTLEQQAELGRYVQVLMKHYGSKSNVETMLRAIGERAVQVEASGGGSPPPADPAGDTSGEADVGASSDSPSGAERAGIPPVPSPDEPAGGY